MHCPVCEEYLTEPLPSTCPRCGKKNLHFDITLNPSLDRMPEEAETRYIKWIKIYRKFFKAKIEYADLIIELNKIKEEFKILKQDTLGELIELLEFIKLQYADTEEVQEIIPEIIKKPVLKHVNIKT